MRSRCRQLVVVVRVWRGQRPVPCWLQRLSGRCRWTVSCALTHWPACVKSTCTGAGGRRQARPSASCECLMRGEHEWIKTLVPSVCVWWCDLKLCLSSSHCAPHAVTKMGVRGGLVSKGGGARGTRCSAWHSKRAPPADRQKGGGGGGRRQQGSSERPPVEKGWW